MPPDANDDVVMPAPAYSFSGRVQARYRPSIIFQ